MRIGRRPNGIPPVGKVQPPQGIRGVLQRIKEHLKLGVKGKRNQPPANKPRPKSDDSERGVGGNYDREA